MHKIGFVQQLQVQTASLKQGEGAQRYYDPAPLRVVPQLRVTPRGVLGLEGESTWPDVHHADHPTSKNKDLINGISFNFTSHYAQLQARFGAHLTWGSAGENILIAAAENFTEPTLASDLWIETVHGEPVHLAQIRVAAPCAPFSTYALASEMRPPADLLKTTLQFLDDGRRGFYCQAVSEAVVQVGATVWLG